MRLIRRLIRASTFNGATTYFEFARRGAWIGLIWSNLVAVIACGTLYAATAFVFTYVYFYRGIQVDSGKMLKVLGGLIGMYANICGLGIVVGAVIGAVRRLSGRSPA